MSLFGRPLSDGDCLDVAGAVVRLKVHSRARRVSLRLDRARREVIATAPTPRRLAEAAAFARDRADWISQRIAELPRAEPLAPGATLHLFGVPCLLGAGDHAMRLTRDPETGALTLAGRGEGEAYARAVIRLIKREALKVFTEMTEAHCRALGVRLPSITMMDAKGRWGSCRSSAPGKPAAIRYSWRLALAPRRVADYVAAHECAHLLELNHGPRFWEHVRGLVGEIGPYRDWLKAEGARLHAFGGAYQ
ncbi:MAG: metal-dependent hydrolase [Alphaproteobacteria bacterium PA2]|nr:MAG: metal-dependent hydrolase [Alphaproteobacteria bacterium PA2]